MRHLSAFLLLKEGGSLPEGATVVNDVKIAEWARTSWAHSLAAA